MVAIPEHGRLEETPFPRLLLDLHRARFSGTLTLTRDRVGKRFLLHEGVPVFAESNLASESLGVQLMDSGKLSRADYNRVGAYVEREQCKEGRALLELELIDPRGLFVALKEQVRLRLLECFAWPRGEFHVDPTAQPPPDAQPLRTDLVSVLQEGISVHWSMERILEDLGPSMHRYARPGRRFDDIVQHLQRDEAVEALLAGLDGERTLWRVAQAARTPLAFAACWVLHETGGLALADAPASSDGQRDVELVVTRDAPAPAAAPREDPRPETRRSAGGRSSEALGQEIAERHALLGTLDYYALLGVSRSADASKLKVAYHRAAKSYHPDALARAGLDAETRGRAGRIFTEIGKAYATLTDAERRREYDASLENERESLDADRLANAETNYRKGEILLRQGNFRGAVDYLRAAVDLWPEEAAYQSALGWALFKKTPSEPEAAREHLEHAVEIDARDEVALSRLATVRRALEETGAGTAG